MAETLFGTLLFHFGVPGFGFQLQVQSSFLLTHNWETTGDSSNSWVLAVHVGDPDWVIGLWFWRGPALAVMNFWLVNQLMKNICLPLSLTSKINKQKFKELPFFHRIGAWCGSCLWDYLCLSFGYVCLSLGFSPDSSFLIIFILGGSRGWLK